MRVKVALGAGLTAYDLDLIQFGHPGPGSQLEAGEDSGEAERD
jgi:hypothetical protein